MSPVKRDKKERQSDKETENKKDKEKKMTERQGGSKTEKSDFICPNPKRQRDTEKHGHRYKKTQERFNPFLAR